jgi:long-subunit fatty acid transport protein
MREVLKDSGTLRAGVEFCATPYLSIRGGFIWSDSAVKSSYDDLLATHIMPTSQHYITGGIGLQLNSSAYIDFAYQYGSTRYAQSANFYGIYEAGAGNDIVSEVFSTRSNKHIAVITFGCRF